MSNNFISLYEKLSSLTEGTKLTEAEDGTTSNVAALIGDIEDLVKPAHAEITKVIESKKIANTAIIITNLTDEDAIADKGAAIETDIIAKVFNNKKPEDIGIKLTKHDVKPLKISVTISDLNKFSAWYQGSEETPTKTAETTATQLTVDKVKGIDLLTVDTDRKAIEAMVNKINSTALKSVVSGMTITKGADFLALTFVAPEASDETTVKSLVTAVTGWIKSLGWKYSGKAPETSKKDNNLYIKFMPIYKAFFKD